MKRRIKGLNRRVFRRNLSEKLKPQSKKNLNWNFEIWVDEYETSMGETGIVGWFEISKLYTKSGNPEVVRTN